MRFEKLGFHGYSSDYKLDIIRQRMSDLLGNDRKMAPHINFKLTNFKRFLDVVRGFFFKFGVIWEGKLPRVIIELKIGHLKRRMVVLAGLGWRNDVT